MPSRGLNLDYAALYARYVAGETGVAIAASVGVGFASLYVSWKRRGMRVRTPRQAALLLHQQRPELGRNIEVATAARRGGTDTMAIRVRRAQTREARLIGISDHERRLAEALRQSGYDFRQQVAIGPYNADFAFDTLRLVLEIDGGGHNPRVRANRGARSAFIEAQGWTVAHVETRRDRWLDVAMEIVHAIDSSTQAPDASRSIRIR